VVCWAQARKEAALRVSQIQFAGEAIRFLNARGDRSVTLFKLNGEGFEQSQAPKTRRFEAQCGINSGQIYRGFARQKNEGDDQKKDNQHPILGFKAEKAKWLNEKLHRFRPFLGQGKWF